MSTHLTTLAVVVSVSCLLLGGCPSADPNQPDPSSTEQQGAASVDTSPADVQQQAPGDTALTPPVQTSVDAPDPPVSQPPPQTPDIDTDEDGVLDSRELLIGTDPENADTDGDTLTDGAELELGTSPKLPDTDFDGLSDDRELLLLTNPLLPDTDFDGLLDGTEVDPLFGTNPLVADTDGDGLKDGTEVDLLLEPLTANATSLVDDLECDDYLELADGSVWSTWVGDFQGWMFGDVVVIGSIRLVNLTRVAGVYADLEGYVAKRTLLWDRAIDGSLVELADGMIWRVSFVDRFRVATWQFSDSITVVGDIISVPGYPDTIVWQLLNEDRCDLVSVTPP